MTDEEIEKAWKDMVLSLDWGTVERVGAVDTCGIGTNPHNGVPKKIAVIKDTIDYINRLKADKERLYEENENLYFQNKNLQTYIDNHEEIWKRNAEISEKIARKKTAEEIFQVMGNTTIYTEYGTECYFISVQERKELAEKYGVEIEK